MNSVVFIFITVLVDAVGFGVILPVLPELIMKLTGEGLSQASIYGGWLWFAYAVMQFFCAPVLGNLSDRFGRRPVILFSLLTFGIDYLIMGFAPTLFWLFVGRSIAGMAGASFTPAYSYLADVSPPHRRAQNFGLIGAAFGAGFILGPAIGGLLGALGTRAPFFAAAGLALINFLFGLFVLPESLPRESRRSFNLRRANPLGTLLQIRKYPSVIGLLQVLFLWQLAHQVFPSTWAYYTMLKFNWSEWEVGISLAFVGTIMAFSTAGMTRLLVPRLGEQRAALSGLLSGSAAFFGYAFASRGWMMYAFLVAWLFAGLVQPSIQGLMSQQVPANAQGELQGGVASLYSLTAVVGPPLMTQLFGYFSSERARIHFPGAAFLCAALLAIAGLLVFVRATRPDPAYSAATAAPL
ncbi:MAG TPA: TCR/Tet family MFS transporter [Candidatus Dormibacteraeota bacterium]|nr:TCR/Tet family MFS transporter [Candidatus Dormibacteraeota bacterium]